MLKLLFGDRLRLVAILGAASLVAALAEALILTTAAQVAADLVAGRHRINIGPGPFTIHTTLGPLLLVALGAAVIRWLLQFVISYYPAKIAGDVQATMRTKLFAAYTAAGWDQQSLDREGHFQEIMTTQIWQASQGALQATTLVVAIFALAVLVVTALALNGIAAITVLAVAVLLFVVLRPVNALGARLAKRQSAAQLEYAGAVSEANSIAEEAKVFGIREPLRNRMQRFVATAQGLFVKTNFMIRVTPGIYQSTIYIILVGGLIAINSAHVRGFSSLGAVILLMVRAASYGQQFQGSYQQLRQTLPYVDRIQQSIGRYQASRPAPGTRRLDSIESLAFVEVSYAYRKDQPALSTVTWNVGHGETIGLVGPSGAGKSTMVQILLRLRFPHNGRYLVNGVDAAGYASEDWSERVAYVPQQPRLVHASVADNVRFFRDIGDEAIERACRLARIHDDVVSWRDGYQTIVGPRADAVSGGQQQRICLARSIAGDPDVLVLDEPTSALDPRSESLIQDSLMSLKHSLTLFIVAHRLSTLTICDRVMVVLDGRLDAFETLDELRASNQYYRTASSLSEPTAFPVTPHVARPTRRAAR